MRDLGACCFLIPLKLGTGIITLLTFISSLTCLVSLLSGDVRFQANGYSPRFFYAPAAVGVLGLVFSFVGLLGIYDEKPTWLRMFNSFLTAKIIAMVVTIVADMISLQECEGWSTSPERLLVSNPPLEELSKLKVCRYARWSYLVGCVLDLGVWLYFAYCSHTLYVHLAMSPSYDIKFGNQHDVKNRWATYGVSDPRPDAPVKAPQLPSVKQQEADWQISYGSMQEDIEGLGGFERVEGLEGIDRDVRRGPR